MFDFVGAACEASEPTVQAPWPLNPKALIADLTVCTSLKTLNDLVVHQAHASKQQDSTYEIFDNNHIILSLKFYDRLLSWAKHSRLKAMFQPLNPGGSIAVYASLTPSSRNLLRLYDSVNTWAGSDKPCSM